MPAVLLELELAGDRLPILVREFHPALLDVLTVHGRRGNIHELETLSLTVFIACDGHRARLSR
jgi:hypothetical protein